jgi:hypothetical protein
MHSTAPPLWLKLTKGVKIHAIKTNSSTQTLVKEKNVKILQLDLGARYEEGFKCIKLQLRAFKHYTILKHKIYPSKIG